MQRITCVLNPSKRGAQRAWRSIQANCVALDQPEPLLLETTIEQPGADQAARAVAEGSDLVVVAGGDGTVREVASALTGTGVPMGVVPVGTANIFHLNAIGKHGSIDQAVRRALIGRDTAVDVARVKAWQQHVSEPAEHISLVVVGIGRDAATIAGLSERLKRMIGPAAYFAAGVRQLVKSPIPMQISIDDSPLPERAAWSVLIANCGVVPGRITVIPGADIADGVLDVLQVAPKSLVSWMPIGIAGISGHRVSPSGLRRLQGRRVTVSPENPQLVQIDGDVIDDVVRLEVTVEPKTLIVRGVASS